MSPRRSRARRTTSVVAFALCAVLVAGCSGGGASGGGETGFISSDGSVRTVPVGEREPGPDLTGATIDGSEVTDADLDGKVVVVNVFASWCTPCRAEAPALERVWQQTRSEGVQFLGLNSKDRPEAAQAFVRRFELTYPSLDGNDGLALLGFRDSLPSEAIPTTWLLDREGRVAARVLGEVPESTLRSLVGDLIAEQPVTEPA
jgi:thiol-disulfide isomerase/thioredoxin